MRGLRRALGVASRDVYPDSSRQLKSHDTRALYALSYAGQRFLSSDSLGSLSKWELKNGKEQSGKDSSRHGPLDIEKKLKAADVEVVELRSIGEVDDEDLNIKATNIAAHADAMQKYRTDTQTLANWLDVSVVKIKGRLYPADSWLLPVNNPMCVPFPTAVGLQTLTGETLTLQELCPTQSGVRLVTFSFKQYGHTLAESWAKPFLESELALKVPVVSLCFVEYGFLSMMKGAFIKGLKSQTDESRWARTGFVFGGVMEFATKLLLPNKFTGYAYLIDKEGMVRWRGIGLAQEEDLESLYRCTKDLLKEDINSKYQ